MPQFKVDLGTTLWLTTKVEAENEDEAIEAALVIARGFGEEYIPGQGYSVEVNNEWQEEPSVTEIIDDELR